MIGNQCQLPDIFLWSSCENVETFVVFGAFPVPLPCCSGKGLGHSTAMSCSPIQSRPWPNAIWRNPATAKPFRPQHPTWNHIPNRHYIMLLLISQNWSICIWIIRTPVSWHYILQDVQRGHPMFFHSNDSPVICLHTTAGPPKHYRGFNPSCLANTSQQTHVSHCCVGWMSFSGKAKHSPAILPGASNTESQFSLCCSVRFDLYLMSFHSLTYWS